MSKYNCESCGEEIDGYLNYKRHESNCVDGREEYTINVYKALERLKDEFKDEIKASDYRTFDQVEGYSPIDGFGFYRFQIYVLLNNGNIVDFTDGMDDVLPLGNYLGEDIIYATLRKRFLNAQITKYVGTVNVTYDAYGWKEVLLDEIDFSDILDRLNGRKIKIEIIE